MPLNFFHFILTQLGPFNVSCFECERVKSVSWIRWQNQREGALSCGFFLLWNIYGKIIDLLPDVPEALTIKIYVSHVGAENLACDSTVSAQNCTFKVVFRIFLDATVTDFIKCRDSVFWIWEFDSASYLVHQYPAPQSVLERIRGWVKGDWRTILKKDFFAPFDVQVNRVQVGLRAEWGVRTVTINSIRSFKKHETDRGVVTHLFEHDFSAIFHASLIRLSQNWVQRLFKSVRGVAERDRESDQILHALDRVCAKSCCRHVGGCMQREPSNCGQDRTWWHTPNRERDFVKLKITGDDHSANLFDQVFQCTSVLRQNRLVVKSEATVFMGVWGSIIIF